MSKIYDIIVLGGGVAGVSLANFASQNGKKVLLLEKDFIKDNASVAAGAFLSPKFGPKSIYNELINRAFEYSIKFFENSYEEFLNQSGMLRLPRNKEEEIVCKEYAKNSIFWKNREISGFDGYFCENAATIDPLPTLLKMLEDCEFKENVGNLDFVQKDGVWQVGVHEAEHLVLATGSKLLIEDEPYIKIKPIFGQKLEAKIKNGYDFHIHRKCSVSAKVEDRVFVGATHVPSWRYEDDENLFALHRQKLIDEAEDLLKENIEIKSIVSGFRSSTTDYFPIASEVINMKETLKNFPKLCHGVKVDEEKFIYHRNLWLHTGHGARGFVLAPYTAKELYLQIYDKEKAKIKEITLNRQLVRYARRIKF